MTSCFSTGNLTVDAIGQMNIVGNITPNNWFKTIVKDNGKPDLVAIAILADIVYWYRPTEIRDEGSGSTVGMQKKFRYDCLQRSYGQIQAALGVSRSQAKTAVYRLEQLGVIEREFRSIDTTTALLNNVMFIHLVPEVLEELTYADTPMPKFTHRGAQKHAQGCVNTSVPSADKRADIYKDNVQTDYSETNPESTAKLDFTYVGKSNVGEEFTLAFLEAWEEVPQAKRSERAKAEAWNRWITCTENNGIGEAFLIRSYRRYIRTQREAGATNQYLASLQTWLDTSKDVKDFSLKAALDELARKKEELERARQLKLKERAEEEKLRQEQEEEASWRKSDPKAVELYRKAFDFHKGDFHGLQQNMEAYCDYRRGHFVPA